MSKNLLTRVVTRLVNEYDKANEYGVSLITIPDFDYVSFANDISIDGQAQLFFLGFAKEQEDSLRATLPNKGNEIEYYFTAEAAEESRNSGNEDVFRILIIKRADIAKISSLRWFPEITLEKVYTKSCDIAREQLSGTNSVIEALIRALRCKPVQNLLSFERVLSYLEILLNTEDKYLPAAIKENYYLLGLCSDKNIDSKNPTKDEFVDRIRRNHAIVERLANLEQAERQSITNYYSKDDVDKEMPRRILNYYKSRNVEDLKYMDLDEVENCLKAVKKVGPQLPAPKKGTNRVKPTALAAQLMFDNNQEQINDILTQLKHDIDERSSSKKAEKIDVDVNDIKLQVKTEPITEAIATDLSTEDDFGCIIRTEVQAPGEAVREKGKYDPEILDSSRLDGVLSSLKKLDELLTDGENISEKLQKYIDARSKLVPYRKRLQDAPMLQVLAQYSLFKEYIEAYSNLLSTVNNDFHKIEMVSEASAKKIINTLMSLDYVFVVGESKLHAIPTPLHPLYLWKYVELAKEILSSKGVNDTEECYLSEEDKAFIIRKADDIPDPLSVMLVPASVSSKGAAFLPLSGRIGMLPVYSNQPQINQSESGFDTLKNQIIRYLCLYPHAGMMLKLAVIDPPSIEAVVAMLKALNNDKEFNITGIEVLIFRTKEVPNDWVEIEDESLNDGMLGKIRGKRSLSFKLKIVDQRRSYTQILSEISQQQHLLIMFDPNEVKIETTQNSKYIHLHPLCVPKIYKYDPVEEKVKISPVNEGSIFTTYSSIVEKLNDQPSTFSHTGSYFHTPLKEGTYYKLLEKADWLVILDQSLKCWDIALRAASEKLFYKEDSYRSVGIYSNNCKKFIVGYDTLVKQLGNFVPKHEGLKDIVEAIREINDDGLLSIVSHTSNKIFDTNHGKGSLGTAITAIKYKRQNPDALIVGLDTQLAHEWLADREDGKLPDLIGIRLEDGNQATIDIIEVKTYSDSPNSFVISDNEISGYAVEQAAILEELVKEMFGATEKITTISRREILREQVFEGLFQTKLHPKEKLRYSEQLNELFAGQYKITVNKNIAFVDFENAVSQVKTYKGKDKYANDDFVLMSIGSKEIQAILTSSEFLAAIEESELPIDTPKQGTVSLPEQMLIDENDGTDSSEVLPEAIVIDAKKEVQEEVSKKMTEEKCAKINKVFRDYGINAYPVTTDHVQEAARFTRFSVELKSGESIRSIEKYKADIGRQLEANGEILINHIKGTKYISVDVPFAGSSNVIKLTDHLSLLDGHKGNLNVIAGQLADGSFDIIDVAGAPHMLIAGTTGSGKTIFLHAMLVSLLHQFSADELELLIIDPKQTDFIYFEGIPHLYGGQVVIDAEEALQRIQEINTTDKEERTAALRSCRSKDIESYNQKNPDNKMKRLVVVIDEYSDLIQAAEMNGTRKDFEKNLLMLLQRVRNLGIHLIIATQRPSAQIVTGALKAVIPFRVSFRLPSHTDSQTILDMSGAENLLGKGDMLMVTESDVKRMQGLYISEDELDEFLRKL